MAPVIMNLHTALEKMMFIVTAKWVVLSVLFGSLVGTAFAHHDRADEQGHDALLQHTEVKPELVMEMTLPHRRSVGNQVMLNFFAADSGETVVPASVTAMLSAPGQPNTAVILSGGDPTFGGAVSTPRGGAWLLAIETELEGSTITFRIPIELY